MEQQSLAKKHKTQKEQKLFLSATVSGTHFFLGYVIIGGKTYLDATVRYVNEMYV